MVRLGLDVSFTNNTQVVGMRDWNTLSTMMCLAKCQLHAITVERQI